MKEYISNTIPVGLEWTEINPVFTIFGFSFFSSEGNYEIQLKTDGGWGNSIDGFFDVPMEEEFECNRIRIRSKNSGYINISYFIKGN